MCDTCTNNHAYVRTKTDMRDAYMIARCLSYGGYHAVYIPTEDDDSVKEYMRMRGEF